MREDLKREDRTGYCGPDYGYFVRGLGGGDESEQPGCGMHFEMGNGIEETRRDDKN